jgi:hypothetical protein
MNVKPVVMHSEAAQEKPAGLRKEATGKVEEKMVELSKRKAEVEVKEEVKAKRVRIKEEKEVQEKESDDESTLGVFDGHTWQARPRPNIWVRR